ncbi:hemolysin III family protein [bacterium]|nr:hemolysin III family protein [bacterium]
MKTQQTYCPVSGETPTEELINTITHGTGFILAIIGLIALTIIGVLSNQGLILMSSLFYGISLVALYASSTFYHQAKNIRVKRILKIVDHAFIYVLIAGSYTPFTLIGLKGNLGWTMFGIMWGIAFLGVIFKIFYTGRFKIISTLSYVGMGWIALFAIKPLYYALSPHAFTLLWLGGAAYTVGALFYGLKKIPFNHGIFHVFVLAGSACHFASIYSVLVA